MCIKFLFILFIKILLFKYLKHDGFKSFAKTFTPFLHALKLNGPTPQKASHNISLFLINFNILSLSPCNLLDQYEYLKSNLNIKNMNL
jgi:hypothetical protein